MAVASPEQQQQQQGIFLRGTVTTFTSTGEEAEAEEFSVGVAAQAATEMDDNSQLPPSDALAENITCTLYLKDTQFLDEARNMTFSEEVWSCELTDEDYDIYGVRMVEMEGVEIDEDTVSGFSQLQVSEAMVSAEGRMSVSSSAAVDVVPIDGGRRRLAHQTGELTTLVVRVVANGKNMWACHDIDTIQFLVPLTLSMRWPQEKALNSTCKRSAAAFSKTK